MPADPESTTLNWSQDQFTHVRPCIRHEEAHCHAIGFGATLDLPPRARPHNVPPGPPDIACDI